MYICFIFTIIGYGEGEKNPNHLNKYKETATEQDYKHNQLHLCYSWTHDCSEKTKKVYIDFHIYKLESVNVILMHSRVACPRVQREHLRCQAMQHPGGRSQRAFSFCVPRLQTGKIIALVERRTLEALIPVHIFTWRAHLCVTFTSWLVTVWGC